MVAKQGLQRFAHGGIAVQGEQQGGVRVAVQQLPEAAANLLQPLTPIFAPVHRGQDHPLPLEIQAGQLVRRCLLGHQQQGIDHRIAGHQHRAHHAGSPAVGRREGGGGKVQLGYLGDQAAVGLLGEGVEQVVGAQPGLHMAHRDLLIEGRQGRGEGRGGVALHQHQIGAMAGEFLLQPLQGAAGDVGEGLLGHHQVQVVVGRQAKQGHHLAHHFAVLAGEHHPGAEILGPLERPDHRCQLDGLRTGAQHDRD